jgi:predicted SprT family Zn-dependent metalloprotease
MFNSIQISKFIDDSTDYKTNLFCSNCGNNSARSFYYIRTVTHGQVYFCESCKEESLKPNKPNEDNY